jgi:hypothetical protein
MENVLALRKLVEALRWWLVPLEHEKTLAQFAIRVKRIITG